MAFAEIYNLKCQEANMLSLCLLGGPSDLSSDESRVYHASLMYGSLVSSAGSIGQTQVLDRGLTNEKQTHYWGKKKVLYTDTPDSNTATHRL